MIECQNGSVVRVANFTTKGPVVRVTDMTRLSLGVTRVASSL